jgi:hypothetical protein
MIVSFSSDTLAHKQADTTNCTGASRSRKMNYRECFNRLTRIAARDTAREAAPGLTARRFF